jgi:hypothetical protein
MRLITIILNGLKWLGLGFFWLLVLIATPNSSLNDGCSWFELLLLQIPGLSELGKDCTEFGIGIGLSFLSFADDGTVSWGWTWFETFWHVALWIVCVVGSHFVWKKMRERLSSLKEARQKA